MQVSMQTAADLAQAMSSRIETRATKLDDGGRASDFRDQMVETLVYVIGRPLKFIDEEYMCDDSAKSARGLFYSSSRLKKDFKLRETRAMT